MIRLGKALKARHENGEPLLRFNQNCALQVSLWPGRDGNEIQLTGYSHPRGVLTQDSSGRQKEERSCARDRGKIGFGGWLPAGAEASEGKPRHFLEPGAYFPIVRVKEGTIISEIAAVTSSLASGCCQVMIHYK